MSKPKPSRIRRLSKTIGIALAAVTVFLLLFVAAFVFNPFEGSLPELRDVVPRGVNFFVRKQRLASDFTTFPEPRFWTELADARGFAEVERGTYVQQLRRDGLDKALQDARGALEQVRRDTDGWLDVMRDVIGTELIVAGYQQDYSQQPPRPLTEPWWCCYTRVTWRVKAACGLAGFGFVQSRLRDNGLDVSSEGDLLVVKLPGLQGPLYVKRHLDVLMVANQKILLEQSQRLIDGNRDEEPIGQMPAYTDGAQKRIEHWADVNAISPPNVLEFVVEPNAFDGFRRFAASWPNPQDRDSMNERVLASFLNLKGWQQVTGGIMFADGVLAATGQVGLNSKQHTPFQSSFYRAEQQRRSDWLDPFLHMVPEDACAAAALRMPAGEFLYAMFEALEDAEKNLIDDGMKRASFQGTQLNGTKDLIDRLKVAFLSRTGFVFRRNVLDMTRDEKTGELQVPVTARSPMPQVAWVFWLRPTSSQLVEELVSMLRNYNGTFGFKNVYHLQVPFAGGNKFPEPVTEFTNPQIPATGEIAMIVFRDFFVLSNSGPLIKDILRTRYNADGARSVMRLPEFEAVERELPNELNGLVWIHGEHLLPVLDDYMNFAESASEQPDPDWMMQSRPAAEDHIRRTRFPQYPSKASMPESMLKPEGEFETAVVAYLREKWRHDRTSFTADDRSKLQEMRAAAQLVKAACLQLELENNYIRFQARVMANFR
ncbi:MAG TPA: hypothetical protein VFZ65_04930 [Planctomycetota bacterium]|nr:hypothetical protein [Planctomycetota bacterium]